MSKLATGVTASLAFLEAAIEWGADAVLVHHGYFWKNEAPQITGRKYRRLKTLLANDLNLFAYHLPLDSHPEFGNNAQIGARLGLIADGRFGDQDLGWIASLPMPLSLEHFTATVENDARAASRSCSATRIANCVAWRGARAARRAFSTHAIAAGADVYLSGEVSEQTMHIAAESGVAYLAAGHHATERFGVQAVGAPLSEHFDIEHVFIDIDNPV